MILRTLSSVPLLTCLLAPAPGGASSPGAGGELWGIQTGNPSQPNGSFVRFDVDSGAILEQRVIAGPPGERLPNDFVFDRGGERVIATQILNYQKEPTRTVLQRIDFAAASVASQITLDGWLDGLARRPGSTKLWATYLTPETAERKLVRVNPTNGAIQILGALPPELFPRGLAFTPDGAELWALLGPNQPYPEGLLRLNPNNGEILAQLPWPLEDSPLAIEFDPAGRLLVYAYDGRLYSVSKSTGALTLVSVLSTPIQHIITGLELPPAPAQDR